MDFDGAASDGRGGHSDSANSDIVSVPEDGGGGGGGGGVFFHLFSSLLLRECAAIVTSTNGAGVDSATRSFSFARTDDGVKCSLSSGRRAARIPGHLDAFVLFVCWFFVVFLEVGGSDLRSHWNHSIRLREHCGWTTPRLRSPHGLREHYCWNSFLG